jgi:hypothetical protein
MVAEDRGAGRVTGCPVLVEFVQQLDHLAYGWHEHAGKPRLRARQPAQWDLHASETGAPG